MSIEREERDPIESAEDANLAAAHEVPDDDDEEDACILAFDTAKPLDEPLSDSESRRLREA